MSIYKKCDIRGEYGVDLTDEHAARLGDAMVCILPDHSTVIVGGDGRLSTTPLKRRLIQSMVQGGLKVVDIGMVSTPVFYFARRKSNISPGVMVTASHNPAKDNGFKITLGELPVTPQEMCRIMALMESSLPAMESQPGYVENRDMLPEYMQELSTLIPHLENLKVVVDCSNGMTSQTARRIWNSTGANVSYLLDYIDGRFPVHPPNPADYENLRELGDAVLSSGADLGVSYDGDGDRVAFVNELGRPISNDKVIVLLARAALSQGPAPIVYDQKCSRIVPDAIRDAGGIPILEQSGHTFIKKTFLDSSAPYAGEITGHHFFKTIQGDDGLYCSLVFAGLLVESRMKASAWIANITDYPITPDIRIPIMPDRIEPILWAIENAVKDQAVADHRDGLRLEFMDGWCLLRPSVTEPMITARFEGINEKALEEIMNQVCSAAPELGSGLSQYRPQNRGSNHD